MDGRQAVAELVGDAGRQLADGGQALLQPQLFLELLDGREVGEQADGSVQLPRAHRTAATP